MLRSMRQTRRRATAWFPLPERVLAAVLVPLVQHALSPVARLLIRIPVRVRVIRFMSVGRMALDTLRFVGVSCTSVLACIPCGHTNVDDSVSRDSHNSVRHGNCLRGVARHVSRRTGLGFWGWSTFEGGRRSQRSVNLWRARAREGWVRIGPRVLRCAAATPLGWPGR